MDDIIKAVFKHASDVQPNECCGLVVVRNGRKQYVRCKNVASEPTTRFVIPPEDYADAEDSGEILMVVHSHVYEPPTPSPGDLTSIERANLPWFIVNYPNGSYTITEPSGYRAPIMGRPFIKGTLDCYALVRDYYAKELRVELPDYDRPENWETEGNSILVENFGKFGFKEIPLSELQPNDCILMRVSAPIPNHCAVYVGGNHILHHVLNRLSSRDVYGDFWRRTTTHYLRYVGVQT